MVSHPLRDFFIENIMDNQGWISLHRKIQGNFIWNDGRVFSKAEAWIDILMEVQHDEKQFKTIIKSTVITCDRGQSIKSIQTWADRWTWSKSAVQRFLKLLTREEMITLENLKKTTRLTVCNYSTYQNKRIASESQVNRKRIADESQVGTDNNDNNANNENNDNNYTIEQVRNEFFKQGLTDSDAEKFFNHYESQGWVKGNGLPILKLAAQVTNWKNNPKQYETKEDDKDDFMRKVMKDVANRDRREGKGIMAEVDSGGNIAPDENVF
jgi:hypothetical protein